MYFPIYCMHYMFLFLLSLLFFAAGCMSLAYGQDSSVGTDETDASQGIRSAYVGFDGVDYILYLYVDFDFANYSRDEVCWVVHFDLLPEDIGVNDVSFEDFEKEKDKGVIPFTDAMVKAIDDINFNSASKCSSASGETYGSLKAYDFSALGDADVYRITDNDTLGAFARDYGMEDDGAAVDKYLDEDIVVFRVNAREVKSGLVLELMFSELEKIVNLLGGMRSVEPESEPYPDNVSGSMEDAADDTVADEPKNITVREKRTFDDPDIKIERKVYWIDKRTNIVAIDPTDLGGAIVSPLEVSIDGVGFEYTDYGSFVFVPDDGVPSMVMVFSKGSIKSTLYMDNDARALLDSDDSEIEIVGVNLLKVDKSDVKKAEDMELYVIEVRDSKGRTNLKRAMDSELRTGSKSIYPQISAGELRTKGSSVVIKEPDDIGFFDIRSISDLFLWLNLKFGMNLENKEKKILQEGIYSALQKAVDESTATSLD